MGGQIIQGVGALLQNIIKTASLDNLWGGSTRQGIKHQHLPFSLELRTRRDRVNLPITPGSSLKVGTLGFISSFILD